MSERSPDRSALRCSSRPLVAVVVAASVIAGALAATSTGATGVPPQTTSTSNSVQSIETFAVSQFAVFTRPQTARDRSLPAVARRAVRLGGLGPGFQDVVKGVIPSLTRYTQTLPDGREVFVTVSNPATTRQQHRQEVKPGHRLVTVKYPTSPRRRWSLVAWPTRSRDWALGVR